jgi:hypothetical protein
MLNWKYQLIRVVSVMCVVVTVSLLTSTGSQAQLFREFAPLERLTESGCVGTPVWDEIIEGSRRWVATMNGAAYCDRQTGLVWEANPYRAKFTWSAARAHCLNRTVGENNQLGWRLAWITELTTLIDKSRCGGVFQCLPEGHPFGDVIPTTSWSATTDADNPNQAWVQFFAASGQQTSELKEGPFEYFAWCVRGGTDADTY